jgi:hypothetical protein
VEDYDLDWDLEAQYEDRFYRDDAEEWELTQVALDRDYDEDVEWPYEDEDTEPPF